MSTSPSIDLVALSTRALLLYSLAEAQGGHATRISVVTTADGFSVEDDGRGHAIHRVISGHDYLPFIYTQLEYPFDHQAPAGDVQLQGIGMSLINALCERVDVVVRKKDGSLFLTYERGRLASEKRDLERNSSTGTTVSGQINSALKGAPFDAVALEHWLNRVTALHPHVELWYNGTRLLA